MATTTVADSNDIRGEDQTDISTGQQTLLVDGKQSQNKTLFGVIVPGARNGTENGGKKGLTHAEVSEDQDLRVRRHSDHTSSSNSPKGSPSAKVKKHKLQKITAHFRNSEYYYIVAMASI